MKVRRAPDLAGSVACLLALAAPAAALDFARVDMQPLVQMDSTLHYEFRWPLLPPPGGPQESQLLLSRGGGVVNYQTTGCCGANNGTFIRGIVAAGKMADLQRAFSEAQIGVQRDCRISSDVGEDDQEYTAVVGSVQVRWFGRAGRRNFFRVEHVRRPTDSALPACSAALINALKTLNTLAQELPITTPGTELVQSRFQGPDT